ncbi:MAG: efflux RND transporter permease subunit [Gammaproteobacteria bacterium]|nr:efflux RND transporter permease subunit [Gammaproteobacteria bacterium]
MNPIKLALGNPTATLVGCLLVILFGSVTLTQLPIQLTPAVEQPEIVISTSWRAAAPEEVESEIIEPQEKQLRGLTGMTELLSEASTGTGKITISFEVEHDLNRALIDVINRLNRVPSYPEDADEPVLSTAGGRGRPIAWFIIRTEEGNPRPIETYRDFVEDVVQTRLERINGVALSEVRGGNEHEVRITVDPYKAAGLGIDLTKAAALVNGNEDISGGTASVGKRRYTLRYAGSLDVRQLNELILEWRDGRAIVLRDIARVELATVDRNNFVITKGGQSIAVNAYRESGVNVLQTMSRIREVVREIEQGPLKRAGLNIEQVYDETQYINSAIELLRNSLSLGVLLAIAILWWFLRRLRPTLVVTLAIPLCLFMALVMMNMTGRTINVVSLAGMAFAVGMVMDAAIIVLENIVRMREQGMPSKEAAITGTWQVWPALFASAVTTVAIFLPIIFLKDQSGQLFSDLAIVISVATVTSLLVASLVIPVAAHEFTSQLQLADRPESWLDRSTSMIMSLTGTPKMRWIWILGLIGTAVTITYLAFPKLNYLPEGNRNLVFGIIIPPPGVNIDHVEKEMGEVIAQRLQPYLDGTRSPQIKHYFFVARPGAMFLGARAQNPHKDEIDEVMKVVKGTISGFPDSFAIVQKASLFSGVGGRTSVDINIQGNDIESLLHAARMGFFKIPTVFPGIRANPKPGLQLAEPELQMAPRESRLVEVGWGRGTMALLTRFLGQGLFVGEYFDGDEKLDVVARVQPWDTPEELAAIPLYTPQGGVLPVSELVEITRTAGPDLIRRLDRRRTVTLELRPPPGVPLEVVLDKIHQEIIPVIERELPEGGAIRLSGSADNLKKAIQGFSSSFVLAVIILYLLITALFRSFVDGVLVILVLPLATVGGVLMLQLLNLPADLLTMLGFIVLLGLVVNNAILLVHQARAAERRGLSRPDAVRESVRVRLRPIFMSTLTSIFGMLPLLVIPGSGSELYKGFAGVIVGGMAVSTVFTLILLPSILQLGKATSPAGRDAEITPA